MVDTFLDVAADSPVPALSGTHSISQYMLLYERLNILISSHKKWYKTRTWLRHDDGKKKKKTHTQYKTKQEQNKTKLGFYCSKNPNLSHDLKIKMNTDKWINRYGQGQAIVNQKVEN